MEAKLNSDGSLVLTAVSGIEAFALNKWLEGFADNKTTISVDTESFKPRPGGYHCGTANNNI